MDIISVLPDNQILKTKVTYPLTLSVVKRHLRVDSDFVEDDDYLVDLIKVATQMAENYLNKDIAYTKNVLRLDDFSNDFVQIMEGNFVSVESAKNSSDVSIGTIKQTSKHYDYFTIEWDSTITSDPLSITFYTGFNNDTPELLKQAILIKVGDLYDMERNSYSFVSNKKGDVFENILNAYQSIRF